MSVAQQIDQQRQRLLLLKTQSFTQPTITVDNNDDDDDDDGDDGDGESVSASDEESFLDARKKSFNVALMMLMQQGGLPGGNARNPRSSARSNNDTLLEVLSDD